MSEPHDAPPEDSFSLRDIWAIVQLQRRVVLGSVALFLFVAITYSLVATRYYTSTSVVHLSPFQGQEISTDRVVDDLTAQWNRQIFVSTQIALLESRLLRMKVLEAYEKLDRGDGLMANDAGVTVLSKATEILPRKNTEFIDIKVTTTDPEQSAILANLTARVFSQESLEANTDAAENAQKWLNEQLSVYEQRIASATQALVDYERVNDLADAHRAESSLDARIANLYAAYGQAITDRVVQETLVSNHERLLKQGNFDELAKQMNTPLIASLTARYADAVTEHARIAAVYGEKMPERRASEAELERIQSELRAEVENVLAAERAKLKLYQAREADLKAEVDDGKDALLNEQSLREGYEKLKVELESARDFYRRLRDRIGELELQAKTQLNRVRIIEDAQPPKSPSYPFVPLNLALGLVGGLVVGLALAFVREWLDDTITSPLDVSTYLRIPFLGLIPKVADVQDEVELALTSHKQPRSTVAEAVRAIRTTLELNPLGEVPRRILITSAVSAEGKTSTAIRLAIAFANLNRKVLIVDGDLRRPRVHKVFGGSREVGFTTLILDPAADPSTLVQPTEVPNLWYLPAGRAGERPNELLASPDMPRVMDALSARFDVVVIDSPPSVILSDARVLSRHADGVILVVREHSTSRALVREATTGLERVGARMLGVVINAVDFARRRTTYKYYYGYGYRYDRYYYDEERTDAAPQ